MNESKRRAAVAVGVLAFAGGVVVLSGAGGGGATSAVGLLSIVGGLLGAAMTYVLYRDWLPARRIDPPAVERVTELPAPGDDFDRTLAQFGQDGRGILTDRKAIHDRLRDLAAGILARRRNDSREEALAAVEDGEWPDDPAVAAFLANPNVRLQRTWIDHLKSFAGFEDERSDFQELVRRTVDALAARSELVDVDGEGDVVQDPLRGGTATRRGYSTHLPDARTRAAGDGAGTLLDVVDTGRWRAAVPVGLALVGYGFAFQRAAVVLAGVVAAGFAVFARASTPSSTSLAVERAIDDDAPEPGDDVDVTTTVRNEGDRTIPDLRVIDGVPPGLSVSDGSPRYGTALRPGESASFTYTVTARRGHHEFGPAYAIVRGYASTSARVALEPAVEASDRELACVPELGALPVPVSLYQQSGQYLGRIPAQGGDGVEFHATREYRHGDPSSRIDWKRLARSGNDELTTVQYRQERAATVVLVIDAYANAYLAREPGDPGSVERSIEAAGRLYGSLLAGGDRVGVAALGPTPLWLEVGTGNDHRVQVEETLATHPAFPAAPPTTDDVPLYWAREFHRRYPAEAQVVLLSPFCDFRYRFVINRLRAYGHPVTILSPDPTVDGTVGQRLVRVERRHQIETLRESGVHVVDWDPSDDLAVALDRAGRRWSR